MTMSAFDLASRYRIPVYVLADAVLGQMIEPLRFPDTAVTPRIDPAYAVSGTQGTRGNVVTSIFLDFAELEQFNVELQEHYRQIEANEQDWEEVDTGDAEIVIVSYGISSRVSRSVVARARAEGLPVGLLRPKAVYPFPVTPLRALAERGCRLLSVEMSNGQMREDIRLATGCSAPVGLVSRMGGCMMTADEVYAAVREVWAQGGRT